ncbi:MBOAT family protein [Tritrichomonas foetus]|uniref:MBOAT family protein n=1 Tax=Tritrichomonas foetus TaxID=1144522 RepID=A0A1J4KKY9_9EUKA|nr:MBOAT family protein [Tritrichomonas foetus]|eukprot:OHT11608.1 MBOAT family protein [Tritrichomonas foetus]
MNISDLLEVIAPLKSAIFFLVGSWLLYPISLYVLPHIKTRQSAAIFHIVYGLVFSVILFGFDTFILLGAIIIGYFIIGINPVVGSAISFAMASFSHILYAIRCKGWDLDISGNLMCLFQRHMSLAFNIDDGRKIKSGEKLRRDHWTKLALEKKPSFLFYFAYTITPYGSFGNPFYEYKVFEELLDCGVNPPVDQNDRNEAFWRFIKSLFYSLVNVFAMSYVTYDTYKSEFYLGLPIVVRCLMMVVFTIIQLARYYPGWQAMEAAYIAAGLNKSKYVTPDEIQNSPFSYVLQSPTSQEWMRRWNHTTHLFWKNYLFTRMLNAGYSFTIADTVTFSMSSAWHGFRPVYYWMLPETLIMMHADKMMCKRWPLDQNASKLRKLLANLFTVLIMTDSSCTFWYSTSESFFRVRNSIGWIPFLLSVAIIAYLTVTKPPRAPKEKKE